MITGWNYLLIMKCTKLTQKYDSSCQFQDRNLIPSKNSFDLKHILYFLSIYEM